MAGMIEYAVSDAIATITLNRPDRLNALTREAAGDFITALDRADGDNGVRAVIVTGEGRAFCAGADLSLGRSGMVLPETSGVERDFGGMMTLRIFECRKPVIGAVNGPAVGIGATMLLAMDARLCSESARFGFVFVARGIVPEAASSWFLPRLVGITTALRWCMSGAMVPAEDALAAGLVSAIVPADDLIAAARKAAAAFMTGAPASVALTRRMLWTMLGASHPMEAHRLDSHVLHERGRTGDIREGVASFLEKRAPDFPDRPSALPLDSLFRPWSGGDFA
jgi:enoyl-CoA hydratase/carnithine racemase